jgi:hypothetical protein
MKKYNNFFWIPAFAGMTGAFDIGIVREVNLKL